MEASANFYPTSEQLLLLQSGLCDTNIASKAWQKYCSLIDIQKLDHVSNNLLPLVYKKFNHGNSTQLAVCKSVYRYTWSKNQLELYRLNDVIAELHKASIDVCLLKGAALIQQYYKDMGLRVFGDVDILVPYHQARAAINLFLQLGWTPAIQINSDADIERRMRKEHALGFINAAGECIDIHWYIFLESAFIPCLANYTYKTRAITLAHGNIPVNVLCPEDQLVHVLLHGLRYSVQPLIRWIPDATMILSATVDFDWQYFMSQAESIKAMLQVKTALHFLTQHQFIHVPPNILRELNDYTPSRVDIQRLSFTQQPIKVSTHLFKKVWHYHIYNSSSQNMLVLLLTLPFSLKKASCCEHWYQVPWYVLKKVITFPKNYAKAIAELK